MFASELQPAFDCLLLVDIHYLVYRKALLCAAQARWLTLQRSHSNLFAQLFNNSIDAHFAEFAFFAAAKGNTVAGSRVFSHCHKQGTAYL